MAVKRTWICDADSDVSALELRSGKRQSLDQAFPGAELCITEPLRFHFKFVFDDANIGAFAISKEIRHVSNGGVE